MANLPNLKKKISSFLTKEDGKISKESLIKTSVFVSIAALASVLSAKDTSAQHSNSLTIDKSSGTAIATHTNYTHSSY